MILVKSLFVEYNAGVLYNFILLFNDFSSYLLAVTIAAFDNSTYKTIFMGLD